MKTQLRAAVVILIAILAFAGTAEAIRKGRLVGRVLDPDGKPVAGVTVTATSADVPGFKKVDTTDGKGVFKIDFDVVNVVYLYRFDKVGYQTLEAEHTWQKDDGTARHDFTIYPGEAAVVEDMTPVSTVGEAVAAYNAGVAAFEAEDHATAIARFEQSVELDPEMQQGWAALAVVLADRGRHAEAVAAAERAVELGATHETLLKVRFESYRALGDEAGAATALEDLERVGRAAEEAKRVFNEGIRLANEGDLETAFERYQEAARIDPNLEIALVAAATTGLKIGRNAEALAAADRILVGAPGNADALRIRYNAALGIGDEELIFDALVGLASVEPEMSRNGMWTLALAANDDNDVPLARERFGRLLEIFPGHARGHYLLGLILVSDGANDEAVAHLERFLELTPDDADAATAQELVRFLRTS